MHYVRTELSERLLPSNIQGVDTSLTTYLYCYDLFLSWCLSLKSPSWFYAHSGGLWVRISLLSEGTQKKAIAMHIWQNFHFICSIVHVFYKFLTAERKDLILSSDTDRFLKNQFED